MQFCCTPKRIQLFTCIVGAASIITVLIILFLSNWPSYAKKRLLDSIVFKNGSAEMGRFTTTADLVNLRLEVYVYNVTNHHEVINSSAKIKLQQLGPFVYHEYKTKELLDNNQTSGLITYKLRKQYTFKPELSVGDPKKLRVNWLNVPLLAAKGYLDKLSFFKKQAAYIIFNEAIKTKGEPAFISDTIENFIFNGSKRELFEYLQGLDVFKIFNPWPLPDNKFAILYNKNNTWIPGRDHVFTVSAGHGINQTYRNLNQYIYMNGSSTLPYWRPQPLHCNKLSGTDGEFFSPFLDVTEDLQVFSSDICRKISLKFKGNVYTDGISVSRYTLDERTFQSRLKYPDNDCYCLARDSSDKPLPECDLDGLIDLSSCIAPNVLASGVHFLYGSPILSQRISGLPPANISHDEPSVHVEPNTGLAIQVKVPLQLNARLERDGFNLFDWFKETQPLIVPMMYVVEAAEMTNEQASMLRNELLLLDSWFISMFLGGTIIFIVAIVAAAIVICMKFRQSRQTEPSERDPLVPPVANNCEGSNQESQQQGSAYQSI